MDSKKIEVFYDVCPKVNVQTFIQLRINNEFGFVENATAQFYENGFATQEKVRLFYVVDESTNYESTFVGTISFETVGDRFFFISLKLNEIYQEIRYDKRLKQAVFSKESDMAFWKMHVYDIAFISRLNGKKNLYIDIVSRKNSTC